MREGVRGSPRPSPPGPLQAVLAAAGRAAAEAGESVFLVGGTVRDLLLGRSHRDVDLAVEAGPGDAAGLAGRLAHLPGWRGVALHGRFGTATLLAPGELRVDVASTRRERYPVAGALPVVETGAPLPEDLGRRDFTVHAMARPVAADGALGALVDPHGGERDLGARSLRLLHPRSLADDPTRIFRAARYAARLSFRPDPGFDEALALSIGAGAWRNVSGDRLRRSLEEVLAEDGFAAAVGWLSGVGALSLLVPGWRWDGPRGNEEQDAGARWRALLAPLPRPDRAAAAARLSFSNRLRREAGVEA
jgi:tRNA nucleotidyltransferase/poly(A) polymerase